MPPIQMVNAKIGKKACLPDYFRRRRIKVFVCPTTTGIMGQRAAKALVYPIFKLVMCPIAGQTTN